MMTTPTRETTTIRTRTTPAPGQVTPAGTDLPERGSSSRAPHRRRFTRHSPAGEVVLAYLDTQAAKLSVLDLAVRRDKPDAVHQMRVTVRRLRSTLQSFTSILSKAETEHVRAELKWLGGVLGAARDNEVLADYLHAGLKAMPTELVLGPVQARVTKYFAPTDVRTRRAVLDALDSERYRELRAGAQPAARQPAADSRGGRARGQGTPTGRRPGLPANTPPDAPRRPYPRRAGTRRGAARDAEGGEARQVRG